MSVILLDVQEFNLIVAVIADPRAGLRLCLRKEVRSFPSGIEPISIKIQGVVDSGSSIGRRVRF